MVEDWIANTYRGMSRRQFLAGMGAVGVGLAGYAIAATPVAGQVVSTPADRLATADGKVPIGDFSIPIYEARPAAAGRYPVVLVIPEVFGMHEHIKDVTRRFAAAGFLGITFEPYAREGGVLHLPDIAAVRKVVDPIPDDRVMADLDAVAAYAKSHPAAQADRIGVTQGALFRHFPDKEAIWLAVFAWVRESLGAVFATAMEKSKSPLAKIEQAFLAHVAFIAANPGVPRVMFHELQYPGDSPVRAEVRTMITAYRKRLGMLFAQAKAAGEAKLREFARGEARATFCFPGNPLVAAEEKLTVACVRDGVDGDWIIRSATHELSGGGYTCRVEAEAPGALGGKDEED